MDDDDDEQRFGVPLSKHSHHDLEYYLDLLARYNIGQAAWVDHDDPTPVDGVDNGTHYPIHLSHPRVRDGDEEGEKRLEHVTYKNVATATVYQEENHWFIRFPTRRHVLDAVDDAVPSVNDTLDA